MEVILPGIAVVLFVAVALQILFIAAFRWTPDGDPLT